MTADEEGIALPPEMVLAMTREWGKESFADFVRLAWPTVEPAVPLVWGRHMDAICEHLEAVASGAITHLIINVPPGHAKSTLVSVMWPAWMWLRRPSWRGIFASYDASLANRDSMKTRQLIESPWYQEAFSPGWKITSGDNQKRHFSNTASGFRRATGVGAGSTGHRGDAVVVDDPMKATEHPSDSALDAVISWWHFQMTSRFNNLQTGQRVIIGQRLHENDLCGHLLETEPNKWEHLCLPSLFDTSRPSNTNIGWSDWRTDDGEKLFPERFPDTVLADARSDLGEYGFAGQHQQDPAPPGGGIIPVTRFRFWTEHRQPLYRSRSNEGGTVAHIQAALPEGPWDMLIHSWDMAFKGKKDSDFVAGGVWGLKDGNFYLLALEHHKWSYVQTKAGVVALKERFPPDALVVEDKANGTAIMDDLRADHDFIAVNPKGGKEARAHAMSPQIGAGRVWLPHPNEAPWVVDYLASCAKFPRGKHDDLVDQMSQGIAFLKDPSGGATEEFVFTFVD